MINVDMTFNGPVPINQFIDGCPPNSEYPGVYIWGFIQNDKFIPFYVGKSHSTVASRLKQHHKDIIKPDSTYMRFTTAYMEGPSPYYNDEHFPMETYSKNRNKLPGWAKRPTPEYFEERIVYMNNKEFLERKFQGIDMTAAKRYFSIDLIGHIKEDYLKNNLNKLNAIYAPYDSTDYSIFDKGAFFELLEAFIKFSLKGKTVSKSISPELMKKKIELSGLNINITNLLNFSDIFKATPSEEFRGY